MRLSNEAYELLQRGRAESKKSDFDLERDFMRRVITLADACGWLSFHPVNAKKSRKGFPDLTLVHRDGGTVIFAELKMPWGVLTTEQTWWQDALTQAPGVEYDVWMPADLDAIAARLSKRS